MPRFSPDGTVLAFLSARTAREPAQVHVIELARGVPWRLAELPHAADLAWTPDGAALVVCAAEKPEDPTAHVIERIDWRDDDAGAATPRPTHLHLVALDGAAPRRLTAGPWAAWRPRVAPDGTVLFLADPRPDADLDPCAQVHRLDPGGAVQPVTALPSSVVRFAPSPTAA